MKITLCFLFLAGLLLGEIRPSNSQKIVLGSGIVFGALAHKQVGQVFKTAASSIVHPVAAIKKVRAKLK